MLIDIWMRRNFSAVLVEGDIQAKIAQEIDRRWSLPDAEQEP